MVQEVERKIRQLHALIEMTSLVNSTLDTKEMSMA